MELFCLQHHRTSVASRNSNLSGRPLAVDSSSLAHSVFGRRERHTWQQLPDKCWSWPCAIAKSAATHLTIPSSTTWVDKTHLLHLEALLIRILLHASIDILARLGPRSTSPAWKPDRLDTALTRQSSFTFPQLGGPLYRPVSLPIACCPTAVSVSVL